MRLKAASYWDKLGSSYWFVPALMTLGAIGLSFILVRVDQQNELNWLRDLGFVFLNQPDGARSLLSTVAGALIGVAGTTFSITLAVLTLTSSQFGPRLLNTFMHDRGNQVVLGTFVATSLYCLLVLRTVRDASETVGPAFVPHLAVTVAVLLTVLSLAVFIYFIHHTADSVQVATILKRITADLEKLISERYAEGAGGDDHEDGPPEPQLTLPPVRAGAALTATESGYLQTVDEAGLLAFAAKQRVLVRSLHRPGTFVIEGHPLAHLWPDEVFTGRDPDPQSLGRNPPDPKTRDPKTLDRLRANFTLGSRRTAVQDLDFLFDQLTEVALRALSPGINDPVTAMRCVDRIGQGLSQLAARRPPPAVRRDEAGRPRVVLPEADTALLVANTFGAIRRFSGDNLLVALHLLGTIGALLENTDDAPLKRALLREAELICETAKPVLIGPDYRRLEAHYRAVTAAHTAAS